MRVKYIAALLVPFALSLTAAVLRIPALSAAAAVSIFTALCFVKMLRRHANAAAFVMTAGLAPSFISLSADAVSVIGVESLFMRLYSGVIVFIVLFCAAQLTIGYIVRLLWRVQAEFTEE